MASQRSIASAGVVLHRCRLGVHQPVNTRHRRESETLNSPEKSLVSGSWAAHRLIRAVEGSRTHPRPGSWPSNRFEDRTDRVLAYFSLLQVGPHEFKCDSGVRYVVP